MARRSLENVPMSRQHACYQCKGVDMGKKALCDGGFLARDHTIVEEGLVVHHHHVDLAFALYDLNLCLLGHELVEVEGLGCRV